jgi:trigger factor
MTIEKKSVSLCVVELTIKAEPAEFQAEYDKVEKEYLKNASIPGFRKGKIPLPLLRSKFAKEIKGDATSAIFRALYPEAIDQEGIEAIAISSVKDIKVESGKEFFCVFDVEIKPEFKLPTYKGLKISSQDVTVTDAALEEHFERFRTAYASFEDGAEGDVAAAGDYVQIDYEGTVGKKKILEINPEAKIVASGENFWTQLEEGRFLPEIIEAVIGMKAGETKEGIDAKFDKESAPEGLKGAKAKYNVTLKALRRRVLPTDEQLVEKMKGESIEKIKADMRAAMEKSAIDRETARREDEATELLLKKVDFAVPPSQVRNAMEMYLNQLAERAQYSGLSADYFKENREKILKEAEETAEKQVRLWFVIEAIAAAEGIKAGEGENANIGKAVIDFVIANAKK